MHDLSSYGLGQLGRSDLIPIHAAIESPNIKPGIVQLDDIDVGARCKRTGERGCVHAKSGWGAARELGFNGDAQPVHWAFAFDSPAPVDRCNAASASAWWGC